MIGSIDFGTVYSKIAVINRHGITDVLENIETASKVIASAVYFEDEKNVIVGSEAVDYMEIEPKNGVQFVKRHIEDCEEQFYSFYGQTYNTTEIVALIFQYLKMTAEEHGNMLFEMVLTCPSCFGIEARNCLKKAAELVVFKVLSIISEAVLVGINYADRCSKNNEDVIICNVGAGFSDIAVLNLQYDHELNSSKILVKKQYCLSIGGCDWNERLFKLLLSKIEADRQDEIDINYSKTYQAIEMAKRKLSTSLTAKIPLLIDGRREKISIERIEFENNSADLLSKLINTVNDCIKNSGTVDKVLLCGGGLLMPMIRNAFDLEYSDKVIVEDPMLSSVKGASLYAHHMHQ